jgi:hypothetical protein
MTKIVENSLISKMYQKSFEKLDKKFRKFYIFENVPKHFWKFSKKIIFSKNYECAQNWKFIKIDNFFKKFWKFSHFENVPKNWKMCPKNLLILKMCQKNFENLPQIFSTYDQNIWKFWKWQFENVPKNFWKIPKIMKIF